MTAGEIPQSPALAEADAASLGELMSRDPEGYQRQDRVRIIDALRADRERRSAASEAAAASGKKPKAVKLSDLPAPSATAQNLGL